MAKQRREVWLSLETAHSSLMVLSSVLSEKLPADDRKIFDSLIEKARTSLDKAQTNLTDALRDAQNAIDKI